jgi:serine/threonine protein kinase
MSSNASHDHYYALAVGTRLHEFEIVSVLGSGGFGITYLAADTLLDETVALKEYLPNELAVRGSNATVHAKTEGERPDFEAGLKAFLEEARLLARFRHPNVVKVRRFFEALGTGYIVLDYEKGETLSQRLARGPMPETELRAIFDGVLSGLEAVHQRAALHRDLKPSNIILREDGTPALIDFGAARDFANRHSRSITAIASPGYSPPEQYGVGGQQGPWTDLYALGAIAYRAVTGAPPVDSLRRLRKDPLVPATNAQLAPALSGYSPQLLQTIDWMLQIDEADRPQSVEQVQDKLHVSDPFYYFSYSDQARSDSDECPDADQATLPSAPASTKPQESTPGTLLGLASIVMFSAPVAALLLLPTEHREVARPVTDRHQDEHNAQHAYTTTDRDTDLLFDEEAFVSNMLATYPSEEVRRFQAIYSSAKEVRQEHIDFNGYALHASKVSYILNMFGNAVANAKAQGRIIFTFDGNTFSTAYAGLLARLFLLDQPNVSGNEVERPSAPRELFAVIASGKSGDSVKWWAVWNRSDLEEAKRTVLAGCKRRAKQCKLGWVVGSRKCIALATAGNGWASGTGSRDQAGRDAIASCQTLSRGERCKLADVWCNDG